MTEKLYCVHVYGQDDMLAQQNEDAALRMANQLNACFVKQRETATENDPIMYAVVEEWPYGKDAHTESLLEQDKENAQQRRESWGQPRLYELVNPSDSIYFTATSYEAATLAVLIVGNGKYAGIPRWDNAIKGEYEVPIFLLGGAEDWYLKTFGRPIGEALEDKTITAALIQCLDSFGYGKERNKDDALRSSSNEIVPYATKYAEAMLKRAN